MWPAAKTYLCGSIFLKWGLSSVDNSFSPPACFFQIVISNWKAAHPLEGSLLVGHVASSRAQLTLNETSYVYSKLFDILLRARGASTANSAGLSDGEEMHVWKEHLSNVPAWISLEKHHWVSVLYIPVPLLFWLSAQLCSCRGEWTKSCCVMVRNAPGHAGQATHCFHVWLIWH